MILLVKSFFYLLFREGPVRHRFFLETRKGDYNFASIEQSEFCRFTVNRLQKFAVPMKPEFLLVELELI